MSRAAGPAPDAQPAAAAPAGFLPQVRSFPRTYWIANTMEIFERMAWYGIYTLVGLYLTDTVAHGGLGLREEQAGTIVGIVTFLLYLMPVITGALADRYGYRKMFILAYVVLTPAYFMLSFYDSYNGFLFGYLMVAIGAAMFKPVLLGTIARTTQESNSQLGFGIFYMVVNIGGFVGPLVAGIVRHPNPATGVSAWSHIFTASAIWIGINFIWVLFFFKEPTTEAGSARRRTIRKVLNDAVEVLGNVRFFLCAFVILVLFLAAGKEWVTWRRAGVLSALWLGLNLVYDLVLRFAGRGRGAAGSLLVPMHVSNWRFALYLLILSGFWTVFNQMLGATLTWYVRDFVQTRPLMDAAAGFLRTIGAGGAAQRVLDYAGAGGQVNPEWISNMDPLFIVLFQIVVSLTVVRMGRFPGMITGLVVCGIGSGLPFFLGHGQPGVLVASGALTILAVFFFAIGEMMASPTSQEYIGRIAPSDKVALYMGYYFVTVALGNLFGGVLGGALYGNLARDRGRPDLMWLVFALISFATAVALAVYNRGAALRAEEDPA
jgi:POT family proton-dependent oligopeptide transporter